MQWEAWSSTRWTQVWNNGYYKVETEWQYRRNIAENQLEYRATRLRVSSINSYYSFRSEIAEAGIAPTTAKRKTYDVDASIPAGGNQIFNLADNSSGTVTMNDDGSSKQRWIHGYFKANLGGQNHVPEFGWASAEITDYIESIDRSGGMTTASVSSTTTTTAKISYSSNVATTLIQYNLNNAGWKDAGVDLPETGGGTTSFTISGLQPDTKYTLQVRHRRDYNEVYSTVRSLSVTTKAPGAPAMTSLQVGKITETSIELQFDGEYADDYPSNYESSGKFIVEQKNGSSYKQIAEVNYTVKRFTVTRLQEGTVYEFRVALKDYYGTVSAYKTVTAKTSEGKFIHLIDSSGSVSLCDAYLIDSSGSAQKIRKDDMMILEG